MIKHEDGFTLVEVMVAASILIAGVLTALLGMGAARKLTLVSERRTSIIQRAQLELERVKSLPYNEVALTGPSAQWSTTPTDYTYVGAPAGSCPPGGGAAPTYQPDHFPGGSAATENLVVNGCTYTISGTATTVSSGVLSPVQDWTDGRLSGSIYDFVTWTADPTCSQTTTAGSDCATNNDYKRVTIVVTLTGADHPSHPVVVSGYLPDPNQNSSQNLLNSPNTKCLNSTGQTISCSNSLTGTPHQYFPCDTSYSAGSCGAPACTGNNLHDTLAAIGLTPPAPDLLGSSLPTGACTTGGGTGTTSTTTTPTTTTTTPTTTTTTPTTTPTPVTPCYALDLQAGCQGATIPPTGGLPIPPTGTSCGSSPPADNTKSHSWVTPGIPAGTTLNLNGAGSMTAYLMSGSGAAVNVSLCLGLYVVPGGILGSLTGNLLAQPIGAAVSANVTAQAGVPTPVSFNFNVGSANSIVGGGILGLPRVEVVVWLAAAAGTNVSLAYDQTQFASQFTLVTT